MPVHENGTFITTPTGEWKCVAAEVDAFVLGTEESLRLNTCRVYHRTREVSERHCATLSRKSHRWCLTVCFDCGLHRFIATSKSGKHFTEYRKHVTQGTVKGIALYTGAVGVCGAPLPPSVYRFFPTEATAP